MSKKDTFVDVVMFLLFPIIYPVGWVIGKLKPLEGKIWRH